MRTLAAAADHGQDRDPAVGGVPADRLGLAVHGLLFQGMSCCFRMFNRRYSVWIGSDSDRDRVLIGFHLHSRSANRSRKHRFNSPGCAAPAVGTARAPVLSLPQTLPQGGKDKIRCGPVRGMPATARPDIFPQKRSRESGSCPCRPETGPVACREAPDELFRRVVWRCGGGYGEDVGQLAWR